MTTLTAAAEKLLKAHDEGWLVHKVDDAFEVLRRALADAQGDEKDAARYRRLRALSDIGQDWKVNRTRINEDGRPERQWMHGATLDAAIDAAMEGKAIARLA